jgi:hypothetical protein
MRCAISPPVAELTFGHFHNFQNVLCSKQWTSTDVAIEMTLRATSHVDGNAPVINGNSQPHANILSICTTIAERVDAFLSTEAPTPLLKQVQEQTRVALGVIDETLKRYRFVSLLQIPPEGTDEILWGVVGE